MKVAINGFGRIGRLFARVCIERDLGIEIVGVNDLTSAENLAYLLEYDSTYGRMNAEVTRDENTIFIDTESKSLSFDVHSQKDPEALPWKDLGVDLVIESTGLFLTKELAQKHLNAGAGKVLMSAPAKSDEIATVVLGVNEVRPSDLIISNASCTTNCIAPALKALQDQLTIEKVSGITVHAYTASQNLQDGPNKKMRSGRAAAQNMIPSTTGAAKAVVRVIPELEGKLNLTALRVPIITGSYVYATIEVSQSITREYIVEILQKYQSSHQNILKIIDAPIVSTDVQGMPYSCVVDFESIKVTGDRSFELGLWYDNEWGYTNRLVDVAMKMM